ncbi:MAG: neutral zinc metallopeptidase [Pelatocladus maniniholoensis HA4357-MV3]|jgi:predicted metalloprotease|uniref:Neutral zinc metallopeptidase n=1 Tax=Pelatocladus maniniholoensis HA4357-MV3 TaxID=1117104 RepID=A0A9E3HB18_9NOST|nr:neutral zinc metallopeptidase [Pelatocladus maniniholoensis HA4357-MV3]BAZ69294.1 neutral zinc metallopeptidase family protein [Fischerella sp. NIES-4106]
MRWEFGRRSTNVEDRRGSRVSAPVVGGGIGAVVLAVIVALLGGDPSIIFDQTQTPSDRSSQTQRPATEDQAADFVSVVLADTEDTWSKLFQQSGKTYVEPKLVLFSDAVKSACGFARSAVGPFYCPADQNLYIDLSFYQDLKNKYQAPGDFAQAYVIAHEVGHHVQNLMGISSRVSRLQRQTNEVEANQLSVRQELQADCFAGVWAYHADQSRQILEAGDVEEALNAASAIGDDRLQSQSKGYVVPESFTHGSSAQRVRWFKRGIQTGNPAQCDTFAVSNL